jgi:hypothetical protein
MLRKIYKIASNHKDFLDFDLSQHDTWKRVAKMLNVYIAKKQYGAKKTGPEVRKRLVAIRTIMKKNVMTSFLFYFLLFYKFNLSLFGLFCFILSVLYTC